MKTQFKSYSKMLALTGLLTCAPAAQADSLWSTEPVRSQFADQKAHAVGDIVTVIVQESNTTRKDSSTRTSKKTSLDASIDAFLYSPAASGLLTHRGQMPEIRLGSKNEFDGAGKINNTESIISRFGVRVVDVLPNRNLIVEGLRETSFSGHSQTVILRGTVRPADITPGNTVFSYNLADVNIQYQQSGVMADAQRKGWFSKVWDKVTPF